MADPTFSPDGKQIAYADTGELENHVWVMDTDGSNAHEILTNEPIKGLGSLQWSPTGDRIAIQDGADAIYTFAPDGSDFKGDNRWKLAVLVARRIPDRVHG
ncbi:MAG: TolB family protein [Actinomycetota bacterium]